MPEKEIPPTYDEFVVFFEKKVADDLENSVVAQDFLTGIRHPVAPKGTPAVLKPAWHLLVNPVGYIQHLATVGTLPPAARQKLGVTWSPLQEQQLRLLGRTLQAVVPRLPERLRYFPIAYEARRLEASKQRLRRIIDLRPL